MLKDAEQRVYIDHYAEAPDWAAVREGPRGGLYYRVTFDELPGPILRLIRRLSDEITQIVRDSIREARFELDADEADLLLDEAASYATPVVRSVLVNRIESDIDPEVMDTIAEVVVSEFIDRLT